MMDKKTRKLIQRLRADGRHDMCDRLIAQAKPDNSVSPRPDLSYSFIMRRLRQLGDKDRIKEFQKAFKDAFDEAYIEGLDNYDDVALMQAIQKVELKPEEAKAVDSEEKDTKKLEAEVTSDLVKLGQAASDLGDPEFAGRAISDILKFLMRKIPYEQRPHNFMSMRQKILDLDEHDMASKNSPVTASMGQSLTMIKTLLNGKDPGYIRKTLEQIVRHLV